MHLSYLMSQFQAAAFVLGKSIILLNLDAMWQVGGMRIAEYLAIVMPGLIQSDEGREVEAGRMTHPGCADCSGVRDGVEAILDSKRNSVQDR